MTGLFLIILLLAAVGFSAVYYVGRLVDQAYALTSYKSASDDVILLTTNISNVLLFYSKGDIIALDEQEALRFEYKSLLNQLEQPLEILKARKDYAEQFAGISKASGKFLTEAEIIFDLINKRVEAEAELKKTMAEVKESRHNVLDNIQGISGKIKLAVSDAGYKEKEYNFQYLDQKHAEAWFEAIEMMMADLKKEKYYDLAARAEQYLSLAQKAARERMAIQDFKLNEINHLNAIKNNFADINTETIKISRSIGEELNDIMKRQINSEIASFAIIFIVFIVGGLFVAIVTSGIIKSINRLSQTARKVSGGDFSQRAEIESRDELGYLARVFNDMLDNLNRSHLQLEKSDDKLRSANQELGALTLSLEARIQERTKGLEEIKKSLESDAKAKVAELRKRVEELEKFKQLTVNRELKMTELKKRIAELEEGKRTLSEK